MTRKPWYKRKTTLTGIGGVIIAIGSVLTGQMDLATAASVAIPSLLGIFLRDAVNKL